MCLRAGLRQETELRKLPGPLTLCPSCTGLSGTRPWKDWSKKIGLGRAGHRDWMMRRSQGGAGLQHGAFQGAQSSPRVSTQLLAAKSSKLGTIRENSLLAASRLSSRTACCTLQHPALSLKWRELQEASGDTAFFLSQKWPSLYSLETCGVATGKSTLGSSSSTKHCPDFSSPPPSPRDNTLLSGPPALCSPGGRVGRDLPFSLVLCVRGPEVLSRPQQVTGEWAHSSVFSCSPALEPQHASAGMQGLTLRASGHGESTKLHWPQDWSWH